MQDTPLLRVSRPVSACARCRSAKIRCDGKLPACTACDRAGKASECSSGTDNFARGKERSYVAYLEARIERLERQSLSGRRDRNSIVAADAVQADRRMNVEHVAVKTAEASDIDELVSDFGYLAINATSNGYHGFDKEMSLARLILSISCLSDLPNATAFPLPPRVIALDLLQACMNEFFTLCPIMSFAAAGGALERVYHHSHSLASPQDYWNVRLMIALGLCARMRSQGDAQHESALRHVSNAIDTVGDVVIAPGSLARLQSLLLLVLFSMMTPATFDSWYLLGMAARFMAEMGLHASVGILNGSRLSQNEERRNLFHVVYALDRFISMTRTMPFCFSDDSVDLDMPEYITPKDVRIGQGFAENYSEDFARSFFQLLQHQSVCYHKTMFPRRRTESEKWTTRLSMYHDNLQWVGRLSTAVTGTLRSRFLAQIFYLALLLVVPREDAVSMLTSYAKAVALECIASYVEALGGICGRFDAANSSRSDDFTRSYEVGQRMLTICRSFENKDYPPIATEEESGQDVLLPSLSWMRTDYPRQNFEKVIKDLDNDLVCLKNRFGQKELYRKWKLDAEGLIQSWRLR